MEEGRQKRRRRNRQTEEGDRSKRGSTIEGDLGTIWLEQQRDGGRTNPVSMKVRVEFKAGGEIQKEANKRQRDET